MSSWRAGATRRLLTSSAPPSSTAAPSRPRGRSAPRSTGARLEVAGTAIERGRAGPEFVRNAAAAIVTLYTGVLGVTFAATDASTLPTRGIAPAVFLALAITCASAYAALLTPTPEASALAPHSELQVYQERRLNAFVEWVSKIAFGPMLYFLHAGVIGLGFGTLLLPAPFVDVPDWLVVSVGMVGAAAVFLVPLKTTQLRRQKS